MSRENGVREVLITREQMDLLRAAQEQVALAQQHANTVADAILRGHGITKAEVTNIDRDMNTLTVVVRP